MKTKEEIAADIASKRDTPFYKLSYRVALEAITEWEAQKWREIETLRIPTPAQWEGTTDDNRQVYIRYRWGYLSCRIGEINDTSEFAGVRGKEVLGLQLGDDYDGYLETLEMMNFTRDIFNYELG